jgi:hypothetical protein
MGILYFLSILEKMLIDIPLNCPIVIIRDVNVNMLLKTFESTMLEIFMNKYKYKYTFCECTTICNTQLNHIWKNAHNNVFMTNKRKLDRSQTCIFYI